jgi:hypothetical protein
MFAPIVVVLVALAQEVQDAVNSMQCCLCSLAVSGKY